MRRGLKCVGGLNDAVYCPGFSFTGFPDEEGTEIAV